MTLLAGSLVLLYFTALVVLSVYALHRLWLVRLCRRGARGARHEEPVRCAAQAAGAASDGRCPSALALPHVTVQLPLYNERFVAERLLDAVGALDYPRARLDVQILDDSTDETAELVARAAARLRARGLAVVHHRRRTRVGFKAGALAAGLRCARGELLLLLDADFVPPPDLIRRLLPSFADPRVAAVQARWTHMNERQNLATRVQACALDGHFLVEQAARARAGLFLTFNGTAGMWRRAAVEDAGGWHDDTLTEDLDLSYRAQLRGWSIVLRNDVSVPGELPETIAAFRKQQQRWARGTIGCARKHLRAVLGSPLPARVKLAALFQLTGHLVYPATVLLALCIVPALIARRAFGWTDLFWVDLALATGTLLPNSIFFREAMRRSGRRASWRGIAMLLYAGIGLAVSNTRALLGALRQERGHFERTPKAGAAARAGRTAPGYVARPSPLLRLVDGSLAAYLAFGIWFAAAHGLPIAVPFLALLTLGFVNSAVAS
ncbi:MAG: glycosyltransferase [Longimicrobiales bacterium]